MKNKRLIVLFISILSLIYFIGCPIVITIGPYSKNQEEKNNEKENPGLNHGKNNNTESNNEIKPPPIDVMYKYERAVELDKQGRTKEGVGFQHSAVQRARRSGYTHHGIHARLLAEMPVVRQPRILEK